MDKKTYEKLVQEIKRHDELYYGACTPEISDYEYDQLLKEVEAIEKAHPEWVFEGSPTQTVSEMGTKGFKQVAHTVPMLSLANTYSREEVSDFVKRVEKGLEKTGVAFSVEMKMDGTAVSVRYEKGEYVRGVTRGNGKKGDDVTQNLATIKTLPQKISGDVPDVLEVRGEVFLPLTRFAELNAEREEEGHDVFANPRNAAAGTLKMLETGEVKRRGLDIVLYGIAEGLECVKTQMDGHEFLRSAGLPAFEKKFVKRCETVDEIFAFVDEIQAMRAKLPFEIDGVVIKVDNIRDHGTLGQTGKSPRWASAYKFPPEQEETIVEKITVQVGRTGVLTPVAELKPVKLAGSTISRATLHNLDEIRRKDIREGDTVLIEKGGDVIPKVVKVNLEKRASGAQEFQMPKSCPVCANETVHVEGEVAIRCPNVFCAARNLRRMIFFASKPAMDIDHLGEKVVARLLELGMVKTFADFYRLEKEKLLELEGFQEKSVDNLLLSVENSKDVPLERFLLAIGIPFVGAGTAELIAEKGETIDGVMALSQDDLVAIDGVGEKVAESVTNYFSDSAHVEEVENLLRVGITPRPVKIVTHTNHPFAGKVFVLTGTLENYSRSEAAQLIKERGGKTSSSVSKKTDYVLAGESAGSKLEKAEKLGVKILSEEEFIALIR